LNDEDDNWDFNTGGEDGLVDLNDESEDELVVFNNPILVPLIDCFNKGFNEVEDFGDEGERLILLLLLDEVIAANSVRIESAEGLGVVNSELVFFSLNPVANEAHPLVFLIVVPFVNEEFELDINGLLIVVLSDAVKSDDLVLNEKSPEVTSVIEVDMPFFPVDSIVLDLLMDEGGVLFVFISFIDDCNCCLLLIDFRHFEQYHRQRGSLISAVLTGGLWHF
jgi:hypothetical protein